MPLCSASASISGTPGADGGARRQLVRAPGHLDVRRGAGSRPGPSRSDACRCSTRGRRCRTRPRRSACGRGSGWGSSREQQDLSGGGARLERAVGVGRVGQGERGADAHVERRRRGRRRTARARASRARRGWRCSRRAWGGSGRREPAALSRCGSTGGTGPDEPPNRTSVPRRRSEASDASNVSLPTESKTACTPRPSVSARTSAGRSRVRSSSSRYRITSAAPASRARRSFSALPTVAMTRAPRCAAQLREQQPDAAGGRVHEHVVPGLRRGTSRSRGSAR